MITWIELVIFGLATWRVSSLIVNEEGPFDIFLRIRKLAGIVHDENGKPLMIPERFFSKLLSCVWCSSVWVGLFWTVVYCLFPGVAYLLALPFVLSAAAILFSRYF